MYIVCVALAEIRYMELDRLFEMQNYEITKESLVNAVAPKGIGYLSSG